MSEVGHTGKKIVKDRWLHREKGGGGGQADMNHPNDRKREEGAHRQKWREMAREVN